MRKNKIFFMTSMPVILAVCSLFMVCDMANAAPRVGTRGTTSTRKPVTTTTAQETVSSVSTSNTSSDTKNESAQKISVVNKSNQFDSIVSDVIESAVPENSFADEIRKQRAAFAVSDATSTIAEAQKKAAHSGSNACDSDLRKCMMEKCGNDFSGCALDGDTMFGDKLNLCRQKTDCTGEEFRLFTTEIKADRDLNARLSSYENVISCGNQYNACILNECGTTYSKCLGKTNADAAVQKCNTIAKECMESDSGLAARFGTAIGKLRESAEVEVKRDEEELYKMRDLMKSTCTSLGAMFDERSFDCVYTVNFFTSAVTDGPTASRKRYAGDTFVCMQEWFGVNATTFKENAYRETRSQTAASSAMLGSGLGTAAGIVSSGAIDRALDTQHAKKDYKEECKKQGGNLKKGECVLPDGKKLERQEVKKKKQECKEKKQKYDKDTKQCVDKENWFTKMTEKIQSADMSKGKKFICKSGGAMRMIFDKKAGCIKSLFTKGQNVKDCFDKDRLANDCEEDDTDDEEEDMQQYATVEEDD